MKLFILTDLEGPAMIFAFDQTRLPEAAGNMAQSKRLLTLEVNACVEGIRTMDSQAEVVVLDGHGSGGIDYELLHGRAELVAGRGLRSPCGLDASFDALFFVGQHAMAGTPEAPLAHTFSSRTVEHYTLNGAPIGEFGLLAAMAGTLFGVPTAFLSGDDRAVAEAQALVPDLVGVATKVGLGLEAARALAPARSRALIQTGAVEACRRTASRYASSRDRKGASRATCNAASASATTARPCWKPTIHGPCCAERRPCDRNIPLLRRRDPETFGRLGLMRRTRAKRARPLRPHDLHQLLSVLLDQMDVLQSMAALTEALHVLLGTYELIGLSTLSSQFSCRSRESHFGRYRATEAGTSGPSRACSSPSSATCRWRRSLIRSAAPRLSTSSRLAALACSRAG